MGIGPAGRRTLKYILFKIRILVLPCSEFDRHSQPSIVMLRNPCGRSKGAASCVKAFKYLILLV